MVVPAAIQHDANFERAHDWSRLLFVLPSLSAGGSERVIATLANHWAEGGRQIGIVTFEAENIAPYYALHPDVTLMRLNLPPVSSPKWRAITHTQKRISALRRSFQNFAPDVIISFLTKTNIMAIAAASGLNIPVVISERNNPKLQSIDLLWRWARALAYPRAFAFVTMTQGAADCIAASQRPHTRIIANPVTLPAGWKNNRRGNTLAAVGRLTEQKRFDRLIDAFAMIADDHPDWSLVIWGEGRGRADLEARRDRLVLQDRIRLPGLTSAPGLWVETADVLVLSSEYEGWANVIAEAMQAGLPVVSFDCPFGPRQIITDRVNGVLVPNGDVSALANALSEVMGDAALRRKLGEQAARDAKAYTTDTIAAQWARLVSEAAAQRRALQN